ncbi:MAG TPA: hypothetical protein VEZ40_20370, partial [Pyrinomonadaceae bacterium]|nr:hypothetical protein [Pyrinomonadaceae bacterium]
RAHVAQPSGGATAAQPSAQPSAAEASAPAPRREEVSPANNFAPAPPAATAAATVHEPTLVAEPHEERGIEPSFATEARPPAAPEASTFGERATPSPVVVEPPSAPAPTVTTPLGGSSRRSGADTEFPVEVSEDERRPHNEARRFARLLVSEIKLYNEQKVKDGRERGNLYELLREDIDRSRQMYDKRVLPSVISRYDYFHHELVNTLAEGNPAKLGSDYPGATV